MDYRMIVSDVDGTLFHSGNQLSATTVDLVQRFQKIGGVFTLATGRMFKAIVPFIQQLNIQFPVIVYNGAQIIDPVTNAVLDSKKLTPQLAEAAVALLVKHRLTFILHHAQEPYTMALNEEIEAHMIKDGIDCLLHRDLAGLAKKGPTKILVIADPSRLQTFAKAMKQVAGNAFQPVFSDWNYLEILPDGASKGHALETLARQKMIPLEQVIAIGDERNDLSMLQTAGMGIAVANACDEVKHQADYVTKSPWNEGLEEVLQAVLEERLTKY